MQAHSLAAVIALANFAEMERLGAKGGVANRSKREGRVHTRVKTGIGRNEKCFCGSGKKYKKCHLNGVPE